MKKLNLIREILKELDQEDKYPFVIPKILLLSNQELKRKITNLKQILEKYENEI
jgi:hypothetical protein